MKCISMFLWRMVFEICTIPKKIVYFKTNCLCVYVQNHRLKIRSTTHKLLLAHRKDVKNKIDCYSCSYFLSFYFISLQSPLYSLSLIAIIVLSFVRTFLKMIKKHSTPPNKSGFNGCCCGYYCCSRYHSEIFRNCYQ